MAAAVAEKKIDAFAKSIASVGNFYFKVQKTPAECENIRGWQGQAWRVVDVLLFCLPFGCLAFRLPPRRMRNAINSDVQCAQM